jgi:hypothetical protein
MHLHLIGHGLNVLTTIFFGATKINGIPNAIDQGVRVMNSKTKVVNVSDEEDVQTPQMPSNPKKQFFLFGDGNANVRTTPFANSNSLKTRACKLLNVKGKPNKKLKKKKRRLSIGSFAIANAINFTDVVKEIELKKWV